MMPEAINETISGCFSIKPNMPITVTTASKAAISINTFSNSICTQPFRIDRDRLLVTFGLQFKQRRILSAQRQQAFMIALFKNSALIHDQNLVGNPDR